MCGIAGVADRGGLTPDDTSLVGVMLQSIAHRGPDDEFVRSVDGCVLGTARLAIIDISGGRQPLSNEDGSILASQNGEIYNYVELRDQLIARGHVLTSTGDTEVIPHLYEDYGVDFVDHLRGMFAIAVWDANRRRLVLVRDRLGKKPLYWRRHGDRLSWGSELKALLADPSLERDIDSTALAHYLGYQYVPAPSSIIKDVAKVPPASRLVWEGGDPRIERYWTPSYEPKIRRSLPEDRDELLELLTDAVRVRLRSDVPVGCFLSGGMDSSVVTALMAGLSPRPVRTFSIGFDVPALDETRYAEAVSDVFATDHTSEVVTLDVMGVLPALARAFDEPFGDPSAIPTFRVAQLAARELKVVLTGDGGDEAFAGYQRYRMVDTISRPDLLHVPGTGVATAALAVLRGDAAPGASLAGRLRLVGQVARLDPDTRYDMKMRTMTPGIEKALLVGDPGATSAGHVRDVMRDGPTEPIDRMLWADTLTYLPDDLLVKMDRATMANSLEARSPLLDQVVVDYAARLPPERKLHGGVSKVVLREVALALMPAKLVDRPKMGFAVPIGAWFRQSLGERYRDLVLGADAFIRDVVDQEVARTLFDEHTSGRRDHGHRLWQLFMLEQWGRTWARQGVVPG